MNVLLIVMIAATAVSALGQRTLAAGPADKETESAASVPNLSGVWRRGGNHHNIQRTAVRAAAWQGAMAAPPGEPMKRFTIDVPLSLHRRLTLFVPGFSSPPTWEMG
jgi:hypothetical protein